MFKDADPVNRVTFTIIATAGIGALQTWGEPSDPDEYWSGLIANSIQSGDFDAIIVQLGTNDCSYLSASVRYEQDIKRIVGAIVDADPEVPVFWLTMHQVPKWPDCASIINVDLQQIVEVGLYPNLTTLTTAHGPTRVLNVSLTVSTCARAGKTTPAPAAPARCSAGRLLWRPIPLRSVAQGPGRRLLRAA